MRLDLNDGILHIEQLQSQTEGAAWLRNLLLNSRAIRALARRVLSNRMRRRIERRWTVKVNTDISAENGMRLGAIFDDDLARLGRWLGLELSCDTFREIAGGAEPAWVEPTREKVA